MKLPALAGSLRLRLLAGTLVWLVLTIGLAAWGLRGLFQEHVTQQLQRQLVTELDNLSAASSVAPGGHVEVAPMAGDARLEQPLSGLYWQIDRLGEAPRPAAVRSRSLWDQVLTLPATPGTPSAAGDRVLRLRDAQGHALFAMVRTLQLPDDDAPPLRLIAAADEALIAEPIGRFTNLLLLALSTLGLGLAAAVVVQLLLALRPLSALRRRLAAVRQGEAAQLEGRFPVELQPLVNEFNHALRANAEIVQRARTQAGNLAHAVHTPLAILANAAENERGALSHLVREQTAAARRQVDYHLARARAAAAVRTTGLHTPVLSPLQGLLRTMQRLHADRALAFELAVNAVDGAFRGEGEDLYEMLGNLIDNAGKWARTRVVVDVQRDGGRLCFTVDDDGPGIPDGERERMFERGVQLDEQRPGAGLGLAIVRELAHTYDGSIQAQASPLGGLRMRLCLPAAE